MVKTIVTPWEVKGEVDYKKLIKEFGISPIKDLPREFLKNHLFRRNIIFGHRDFNKIVEAVKKKKEFAMMTGLMPSGKFHFGHKLVADQIIFYQNLGAKIYLAIADVEAYNSRNTNIEELKKTAIDQYLVNYIALGLKPKDCNFYFQSSRSKNAKKSNAYYNLALMLSRHATFNEFKAVYGSIEPGKIASSLLQASDMLHPQLKEFEGPNTPTVIPVGADQDPHLRIARGMSKRIKVFRFGTLSSTYHKFIPGLKNEKMSSSDVNSYIALTDSPEKAAYKIRKYAFSGGQATVKEHKEKGGNPDVDISYQFLRMMFEPNDKKIEKIYHDYKSGSLLTSELKEILIKKVNEFLKNHQANRKKAEKQVEKFMLRD